MSVQDQRNRQGWSGSEQPEGGGEWLCAQEQDIEDSEKEWIESRFLVCPEWDTSQCLCHWELQKLLEIQSFQLLLINTHRKGILHISSPITNHQHRIIISKCSILLSIYKRSQFLMTIIWLLEMCVGQIEFWLWNEKVLSRSFSKLILFLFFVIHSKDITR